MILIIKLRFKTLIKATHTQQHYIWNDERQYNKKQLTYNMSKYNWRFNYMWLNVKMASKIWFNNEWLNGKDVDVFEERPIRRMKILYLQQLIKFRFEWNVIFRTTITTITNYCCFEEYWKEINNRTIYNSK